MNNDNQFIKIKKQSSLSTSPSPSSNLSILIIFFNKFPNYPNAYLKLESFMKSNNQFIKIKKQQPPLSSTSSASASSSLNEQLVKVNRNGLISEAIEIILKNWKYSKSDMAQCYLRIASMLEGDEKFEFKGYNYGFKIVLSKKELYVKAIEVIEKELIDIPINQLLQLMSSNEKIMINGKLHSIIDISNLIQNKNDKKSTINRVTTYCILKKIFKRDKCIDEYIKFNQLFLNERDNLKSNYIESIQNGSKESIDYLNLSLLIENNEKVTINGETSYGKIDLLLYAIHYGDKYSIEAYYQLSKQLPKFDSTIKLLNDTVKTKLEIQMETLSYIPNSLFDYSTHLIDLNELSQDETENLEIFDCLTKVISMDPSFSLAYLKLGIQMQKYSIDECEIPIISFEQQKPLIYGVGEIKFTRMQLFIKFLKLSNTDFTLNENDILLGWYHLALEMNSNEIQFGKTKKEILLSIVQQDETFTRAKDQLSILLSPEYDKTIELIKKPNIFETYFNFKSNQKNKSYKIIKDNGAPGIPIMDQGAVYFVLGGSLYLIYESCFRD
ncbi:hypothetical protein ACTFIZ_007832 [Dictyostelium cf. discoideum]